MVIMNTQNEQNKLREQLSELTPEQINSMKEELNDIKKSEFPSDAIVSRKRMMKGKMSPLGTYLYLFLKTSFIMFNIFKCSFLLNVHF